MLPKRMATVTVAACLLATIPSVAVATPEAELEVDVTVVSEAQVERAANHRATASERARATEAYLDAQARTGRLVDEGDVEAAVVGGATVVWDEAINVDSVVLAQTVDSEGREADLEVALTTSIDDAAPVVGSAASTGLGLEVTSSLRGGTRVSGNCATTTVNNDSVTTCFAKYKASYTSASYNYYYYERWATATGRTGTWATRAYAPAIIDIRSRPWAGSSAASHTKQLNDYWPRGGSTGCSQVGSVGYTSAGMSMNVPLQNCDMTTSIPNATTKTMGVIYDQGGYISDGRTRTASFGMTVAMDKGYVANMADYTYAKFCLPNLCLNQSGNLRKDAGW